MPPSPPSLPMNHLLKKSLPLHLRKLPQILPHTYEFKRDNNTQQPRTEKRSGSTNT